MFEIFVDGLRLVKAVYAVRDWVMAVSVVVDVTDLVTVGGVVAGGIDYVTCFVVDAIDLVTVVVVVDEIT